MADTATTKHPQAGPMAEEYFADTPVASLPGQEALVMAQPLDGHWVNIRLSTGRSPEDLEPFLREDYEQRYILCYQHKGMSPEMAYFEGMIRLMIGAAAEGWQPSHVRFMAHHDEIDGAAIGRCFLSGPKAS